MGFTITMSYREMAVLAVFAAVVCAPFAAITVISLKMNRRAWWPALPWALLAVVTVGTGVTLVSLGAFKDGFQSAPAIAIVLVIGGWIACMISLLILAVVGPNYSVIKVGEVF